MNWIVALFVGILIGWLIEWVIDWMYWRRRGASSDGECEQALEVANREIADLKAQLAKGGVVKKDKLQKIKGVGPVIERKLNEAGIYSFADLAEQTPESLEGIVGEDIRNLADEDELIRQAKQFAADNS